MPPRLGRAGALVTRLRAEGVVAAHLVVLPATLWHDPTSLRWHREEIPDRDGIYANTAASRSAVAGFLAADSGRDE
jgi:hypothetical protein